MKHFKIHLLFNNPKKYRSCDQYPKKYRFSKFKTPKYTPLILVCKYAKSIPWGGSMDKGRVDHGNENSGSNGNVAH